MKKITKIFTIIALCLTLSACWTPSWWQKKPVDGGAKPSATQLVTNAVDATTTAMGKEDAKTAEEKKQTEALLSKTKANIGAARVSNQGNPDGAPKVKVEGELKVAANRLDKVVEDPAEVAAAKDRELLVEQGKTIEARAAYEKAAGGAKQQAADLATAQTETKEAHTERDATRQHEIDTVNDYKALITKNQTYYNQRLKEADDETMKMQVRALDTAAVACLVLFGLGLGFGGAVGLKFTWPFGVIAALCFGLAQLISQWWFMYACGAAVLIGMGCVGWWAWRHYKLGDLKAQAEAKANTLNNVLGQVVPVLDNAYDNAKEDEKKVLDHVIFEPLSQSMNRDEKTLIHQVRAVAPQGVPVPTPLPVPPAPPVSG